MSNHDTAIPLISVIIPCFNQGDVLERCLTALARQDFTGSYEVLVVDNGSSRNIPRLPPDDRFVLIREDRPGSYVARNTGLRHARAQLIAFTDSDCIPGPGWLSAAWRAFEDESLSLLAGHVDVFPLHPGEPTAVELFEARYAFRQADNVRAGWCVTANLFLRTAVVQGIGSFDESSFSGGDAEFTRRATSHGFRLGYGEDARVAHPARRSMSELMQLRRRIVGGHHRLSRHDPHAARLLSAGAMVRDMAYMVRQAGVLLLEPVKGRAGWRSSLSIVRVLFCIRLYALMLQIAYRSGLIRQYDRQ